MIKELTQPEGTTVLKISTEVASISATSVAKESSQPGKHPKDLPSMSSQPSKTSEFDILTLSMVIDIVVMTTGDAALTQAEEPVMDIGAKDTPVEASTEKVITMEPTLKVATQEAITVPNPEAPVVISEMRQLLTQLAPALLGGTSVPPSTAETTIVATRLEILLRCQHRLWASWKSCLSKWSSNSSS